MKVKGNHRYWKCKECNVKTSMKYGTLLYQSNIKLMSFILLAYCFTERNRNHSQTSNDASLPQENYMDRTLSSRPYKDGKISSAGSVSRTTGRQEPR
jgi:hypothetical protein